MAENGWVRCRQPRKDTVVPSRSQVFPVVRGSARQCVALGVRRASYTTLGEFGGDGLYSDVLPIADSNSLAEVDAPLSQQVLVVRVV